MQTHAHTHRAASRARLTQPLTLTARARAHTHTHTHTHTQTHAQGRVACEVNTGDELVTTELIFGGVLSDLTPEEAVALLSALVFQVCFVT